MTAQATRQGWDCPPVTLSSIARNLLMTNLEFDQFRHYFRGLDTKQRLNSLQLLSAELTDEEQRLYLKLMQQPRIAPASGPTSAPMTLSPQERPASTSNQAQLDAAMRALQQMKAQAPPARRPWREALKLTLWLLLGFALLLGASIGAKQLWDLLKTLAFTNP